MVDLRTLIARSSRKQLGGRLIQPFLRICEADHRTQPAIASERNVLEWPRTESCAGLLALIVDLNLRRRDLDAVETCLAKYKHDSTTCSECLLARTGEFLVWRSPDAIVT